MVNVKAIIFWVIGTVCIFFGALIAGKVEPALGSTTTSIALAWIIAFILILIGGMLWITTSVLTVEG